MSLKKQKLAQKFLISILALYAVAFIGLNILGKYMAGDSTKELIKEKSIQYLDKKISLADNLSLSFSWNFSPHLIIKDINVDGLLTAKEIDCSLSAWQLLLKEIYIKKLSIKDFNLTLKDDNSKKPLDKVHKSSEQDKKNHFSFLFDQIHFSDGVIKLIDSVKTQTIKINNLDLANNNYKIIGKADINLMGSLCQLQFNANLRDLNHVEIDLKKLSYNNIMLNGELVFQNNLKTLTGNLFSDTINLAGKGDNISKEAPKAAPKKAYAIPEVDIPVAQITSIKLDLSYTIKKLILSGLQLNNIKTNIKQNNGALALKASAHDIKDSGDLNLNLNYNLNQNMPASSTLSLDTSVNNTSLANIFIKDNNEELFANGDLKITTKITSSGDTLKKLIANSNGRLLLQTKEGTIYKNFKSNNLIALVLDNTMSARKSKTDFKCIVINTKISHGTIQSNKGIALEAGNINMQSSGTINLNNGNLNLSVKPSNTTNNAKIDAANLLNMLQITGTINNPNVSLNAQEVAKQGAAAALTALFGGELGDVAKVAASTLTGKVEHPCQTALDQ
jgi:hypothetical protein